MADLGTNPFIRNHSNLEVVSSCVHSIRVVRAPANEQAPSVFVLLSLALVASAFPQSIGSTDPTRYLEDVKALTTPSMEGRGDGTKGLTRAAHLLESRYKHLGLKPAGTNSYFQPFTVITGARLKSHNRITVAEGAQKRDLKLNQEFVPFSFSASGSVTAPVVFAGYGATAEEFGYDDYSGIDVKDKIVVVLRYEPPASQKRAATLV